MAGYLGAIPVPQATQHRESFTATSGQTTFATAGYTVGFLDVYLNGSHLSPADFTATNGSDVVLASGASADDVCDIISYTAFEVNSQTFTGGLDVTGTVTADGLTVDGDVHIDDAVPILRLDSPSATWSGGEDLGGIDWYTKDTSGSGPAVMARIYSESSGSNALPIPNMIFQTSLADVTLKDRMQIAGNGDISFYEDTGSTAKLFWDASAESLGIGTSSPSTTLAVETGGIASLSSYAGHIVVGPSSRTSSSGDYSGGILFDQANGVQASGKKGASITGLQDGSDVNSMGITFNVHGTDGNANREEAMRLDSSGRLLIRKTSAVTSGSCIEMERDMSSGVAMEINNTASSGTQNAIHFRSEGGVVGKITMSTSATAYVTSSDYRLKTDVQPMTGASDRVQALKPVNFEWISDGTRVDGFLAHEAQAVVPECVSGTKDGMMDEEYQVSAATGDIYTPATDAYVDEDGNDVDAVDEVIHSADVEQPETLADGQQWRETTAAVMDTRSVPDYQGIDQSKMVPLLVAALQEALARITALEG